MSVTLPNYHVDYDSEMGVSLNEILYTIKKCKENPEFRVGIFISHPQVRYQCAEFVTKTVKSMSNISLLNHRLNGAEPSIVLSNMSKICFLLPSDNARGHRCHMVLIDDDIDTIVKKYVIDPLIVPYRADGISFKAEFLERWFDG